MGLRPCCLSFLRCIRTLSFDEAAIAWSLFSLVTCNRTPGQGGLTIVEALSPAITEKVSQSSERGGFYQTQRLGSAPCPTPWISPTFRRSVSNLRRLQRRLPVCART